jgi:acyl carrier protein
MDKFSMDSKKVRATLVTDGMLQKRSSSSQDLLSLLIESHCSVSSEKVLKYSIARTLIRSMLMAVLVCGPLLMKINSLMTGWRFKSMINMISRVHQAVIDLVDDPLDTMKPLKSTDHLEKDFGLDSFDRMELVMTIEEEFDIEVTDEESDAVSTVGDLEALVRKHTSKAVR